MGLTSQRHVADGSSQLPDLLDGNLRGRIVVDVSRQVFALPDAHGVRDMAPARWRVIQAQAAVSIIEF